MEPQASSSGLPLLRVQDPSQKPLVPAEEGLQHSEVLWPEVKVQITNGLQFHFHQFLHSCLGGQAGDVMFAAKGVSGEGLLLGSPGQGGVRTGRSQEQWSLNLLTSASLSRKKQIPPPPVYVCILFIHYAHSNVIIYYVYNEHEQIWMI